MLTQAAPFEVEPGEQPDLSALFPNPEPEPVEPPVAEMVELADFRSVVKPKRKRPDMSKVKVETKRSKPDLRGIGIPKTAGRKSTSWPPLRERAKSYPNE